MIDSILSQPLQGAEWHVILTLAYSGTHHDKTAKPLCTGGNRPNTHANIVFNYSVSNTLTKWKNVSVVTTIYYDRKISMQLSRVCVIWHEDTAVYFIVSWVC